MNAWEEFAAGYFREAARPRGVRLANHAAAVALEDRWLEQAYEAERDGNPKRARCILSWVERLGAPRG